MADPHATTQALFERCRRDHNAWINGNANAYKLPHGATMMAACGGVGRSGPVLDDLQRQGCALWEWGIGDVELIDAGVSSGIAWLIMVEDAEVKFLGHDEPTRWALRVTELFRDTTTGWERFHRHADPLIEGHPLDEVLALTG